MHKKKTALLSLRERYGDRLTIRVSIDHYGREVHKRERGRNSWPPTINAFKWLAENGFSLNVANRYLSGEPEAALRHGFARLFPELGVELDADDPVPLIIFPEMDAKVDVPEITEACWGILNKSPADVMCARAQGRGTGMRWLSWIVLALAVVGCPIQETVYMKNPVTGQIVPCGPYDIGETGVGAMLERGCIEDYGRQGYVRVPGPNSK